MTLPTYDALKELGFVEDETIFSDGLGGLSFDFGNFKLEASHCVNRLFANIVLLSGVMMTPRTVAEVRTEMPQKVDSIEQAAALVAYCLDKHSDGPFRPEVPVPWLELGRQNQHLLPWAREGRGAPHRSRAMTDDRDNVDRWRLSDLARGDLARLAKSVRSLSQKVEDPDDLIAIGEAWQAIEQILEGQPVDVDVGFNVGFRRGCGTVEEGLFMGIRVNDEELLLDELNTTWSSDVGSDHSSHMYARLSRDGGWDSSGFNEWLNKFVEVLSSEDARLTTERDHI